LKVVFIFILLLGLAGSAAANPRPLPFSYPHETLPHGAFEIEQYLDVTPVRVEREDDDGTRMVVGMRYDLQTEFEYGVTDRLEVGWYFFFFQAPTSGGPALAFRGVKQRARYRLNEPGEWPVNVGLYLEVAELNDEVEVEEKILLSRRFGRINAVANLWVEQEYYFQDEDWKHIYNPTLGVTAELSPKLIVGAEYWGRGRFDGDGSDPTRHYVGPTAMLQEGEYFLSLGAYVRLDNFGETAGITDPFGRLWVRAVLGIGL
jgi:hypothetical protein